MYALSNGRFVNYVERFAMTAREEGIEEDVGLHGERGRFTGRNS